MCSRVNEFFCYHYIINKIKTSKQKKVSVSSHLWFFVNNCVARYVKALGYRSGGHAFDSCHGYNDITYALLVNQLK